MTCAASVLLALAAVASSPGGVARAQTGSSLQLRLLPGRITVHVGDHVDVALLVRNAGPYLVLAPDASPWQRFGFVITGNGVTLVPKPIPRVEAIATPQPDFLNQGDILWTDVDLAERYDFSRPGKYVIRAAAQLAPASEVNATTYVRSGPRIALQSNPVTVVVLPSVVVNTTPTLLLPKHIAFKSADQVIDTAVAQLRGLTYPRYISFTIEARSTIGGRRYDEGYTAVVDTQTDAVVTQAQPIWTTNKPVSPYGFNISFFGLIPKAGNEIEPPFGTPRISPLFAFGLRRPAAILNQEDLSGDQNAPDDTKVLGRITTIGRDYSAALVGIETYAGHKAYHLKLTPLLDPGVYRVRDLWVDTQSYVIWGLTSAGIFDSDSASKAPWNVTYDVRNGNWFMVDERTASNLLTGGGAFGVGGKTFSGFEYVLSGFDYPKREWDFDFFDRGPSEAIQE